MNKGSTVARGFRVALLLALCLASSLATKPAAAEQTAAERLAEAIRLPTISWGDPAKLDAEAFLAFHALVERQFPRVHASLARETVNQYSLLYTWTGSDPALKPILLTHHFDVVPVPDATLDEWEQPPFSGTIADGFVWGRGAMDDKSGALAILEAAEELLTEGFTPRRTLYLAFGHDEEVGGDDGAGKTAELLRQRGVELYFSLDEGLVVTQGIVPGVKGPVALIGVAEKGYMNAEVTAHVTGGHSSTPPRTTAIGKLARAVQRIEEAPMPARLAPPSTATFDALAPHMSLPLRTMISNRWLFGRLLLSRLSAGRATNAMIRTTTAVTMVQGGVKENVLPDTATATVNFRLLPGDTGDDVLAHLRRAVDDPDVTVTAGYVRPASPVADVESPSYELVADSLRELMPEVIVAPGITTGGTDTKHYVSLAENSYRFTPMRLGPEDVKRAHGVNERIAVDNHAELIAFYVVLMRRGAE